MTEEMLVRVPVYSSQTPTPKASEIIRAVVNDSFPHQLILFDNATPQDMHVLVFGSQGPEVHVKGRKYTHTYSVAQIVTKANVATVLTAAINQFAKTVEPLPAWKPVHNYNFKVFEGRDWKFYEPVVIDIETDGNLGKTHTPEEVNIISIALYQEHMPAQVLAYGPGITMSGQDIGKFLEKFQYGIYHNGKFDTRVLNRVFGIKLDVWFDTMLAHHSLNHAAGDHKLKHLAQRYLGAPEWEADLKKYTKGGGHYELIPLDKLVEYNGWDVYWTYRLYQYLAIELLADENAQKAFRLEMSAADLLLDIEAYGIPMDMKYAREYAHILNVNIGNMKKSFHALIGHILPEFNPNSPMQVKKVMDALGFNLGKTDEETLNAMLALLGAHRKNGKLTDTGKIAHNFIVLLLEYRGEQKILGTYVEGWTSKARYSRVHPTFLVHGTTTGRLSSTSPNAQNVPRAKNIRKLVRTVG